MSIDIANLTQESLTALDRDKLVEMVITLHEQNELLKKSSNAVIASNYEKRLEALEREVNKDKQYARRETIGIVGMDSTKMIFVHHDYQHEH